MYYLFCFMIFQEATYASLYYIEANEKTSRVISSMELMLPLIQRLNEKLTDFCFTKKSEISKASSVSSS